VLFGNKADLGILCFRKDQRLAIRFIGESSDRENTRICFHSRGICSSVSDRLILHIALSQYKNIPMRSR
jgi:hypothetical protein